MAAFGCPNSWGERQSAPTILDGLSVNATSTYVLEMFRRALPNDASRSCLDRLSNRLTKIVTEVRKLHTQ